MKMKTKARNLAFTDAHEVKLDNHDAPVKCKTSRPPQFVRRCCVHSQNNDSRRPEHLAPVYFRRTMSLHLRILHEWRNLSMFANLSQLNGKRASCAIVCNWSK